MNRFNSTPKNVHALLPRLISEIGHIFHYHIFVQKALEEVGWSYKAYVPQKTKIDQLPTGWKRALANDLSEKPKGFFLKIQIFLANVSPFRRIFREIEQDPSAVVFIEHFELPHLASIAAALLFLKPRFHFWILFRYEFGEKKLKGSLCRLFLQFMHRKVGKKHVKCLTDSDLLAEALQKELKGPCYVVPIPHVEVGETEKREGKKKIQQFWWPGGLIREDKGLSIVRQIAKALDQDKQIQLVMAEKGKSLFKDNSQIRFIPTSLPREEYLNWMQKADLILLPYSGSTYSRSTSGIFVEAVSFGAIPVVTRKTWMAYELEKFGLKELTFDWKEANLLDRLTQLSTDRTLLEKLERMRTAYREFHCERGFALRLQHLLEEKHD